MKHYKGTLHIHANPLAGNLSIKLTCEVLTQYSKFGNVIKKISPKQTWEPDVQSDLKLTVIDLDFLYFRFFVVPGVLIIII